MPEKKSKPMAKAKAKPKVAAKGSAPVKVKASVKATAKPKVQAKAPAKVSAKAQPKAPLKTTKTKVQVTALPAKTPVKVKAQPKAQVKIEPKTPMKEPTKKTKSLEANLNIMGIAPYQEKKGEEYMGEKQKEHFRNILGHWKQGLMEEVDRTLHHMQDDAANYPDPSDRATQEEEFNLELRARDRERKLIKKIESTLQRIDHNDYGFCDACGIEIGIRRLEARPTATLCIDCKTLEEIREKQGATSG